VIPASVFAFEIDEEVLSWQDRLFSHAFIFSFPVAPLQGAYGQASATSGEYRGSHQVEKSMTPDLISQKQ